MFNKLRNPEQGFGLLEVVIAVAILSITLFSMVAVSQLALKASSEGLRSIKASFLAEEGIEALRLMRDDSWTNISGLSTGSEYYLVFSEGAWNATTAPQTIDDIFERKFVLEQVYRDANDNMATSGTLDADARRIVMSVLWGFGGTPDSSFELTSYITNLFGN